MSFFRTLVLRFTILLRWLETRSKKNEFLERVFLRVMDIEIAFFKNEERRKITKSFFLGM